MTTTNVPQTPEAGAFSNVIDLAERRAARELRRGVDPADPLVGAKLLLQRSAQVIPFRRRVELVPSGHDAA